jgi:hypothetical protein
MDCEISWGRHLVRGPGPALGGTNFWSVSDSEEQVDPPLLLILECLSLGEMNPFILES